MEQNPTQDAGNLLQGKKKQANIIEWYIIFTWLYHNYYNYVWTFFLQDNNIHPIFKKIYAGQMTQIYQTQSNYKCGNSYYLELAKARAK